MCTYPIITELARLHRLDMQRAAEQQRLARAARPSRAERRRAAAGTVDDGTGAEPPQPDPGPDLPPATRTPSGDVSVVGAISGCAGARRT